MLKGCVRLDSPSALYVICSAYGCMLEAMDGCYKCTVLHVWGFEGVVWSHTMEFLPGFSKADSVLLQSTPVWGLHPVVVRLRVILQACS